MSSGSPRMRASALVKSCCHGQRAGSEASTDALCGLGGPGSEAVGGAVGYGALCVVARGVGEADGLGSGVACTPGAGARRMSMRAFAGSYLSIGTFCEAKDPQAKGVVEWLQGYLEANFEPGRRFANHLDFQLQLDAWFEKANGRAHGGLRARPVDRLAEEIEVMRPLPVRAPDVDRRWVTRVAPDPYLRFDTNDYSLDPGLVGRRVEVPRQPASDHRYRTGHGRARLPARAELREEPHDHRPGACQDAQSAPRAHRARV
jgi:hypothetical protein